MPSLTPEEILTTLLGKQYVDIPVSSREEGNRIYNACSSKRTKLCTKHAKAGVFTDFAFVPAYCELSLQRKYITSEDGFMLTLRLALVPAAEARNKPKTFEVLVNDN